MRYILLIIFMLSVTFGADKCKEIDRQTMNSLKSQIIGEGYTYELVDMKIELTFIDFGCKNNTFIAKANVATNFYVDNEIMDYAIASMYDEIIGEYCYKWSNAVKMQWIFYFNNYANSKSITLSKKDCL